MKPIWIFNALILFSLGWSSCQQEALHPQEDKVQLLLQENDESYKELMKKYGITDREQKINRETAQSRNHRYIKQFSKPFTFMPAGVEGGGVLEPGTFFTASGWALGILVRSKYALHYGIRTDNLPPGAYTTWWVIFNHPESCEGANPEIGTLCADTDLFNLDTKASILWSTSSIVHANGRGYFSDKIRIGDDLGIPGEQHIQGEGLLCPKQAEVHIIIKYHGPVSNDPAVRYKQLTTLLGSSGEGANGVDLGPAFGGVHCFDPQFVPFPPKMTRFW